MQTYVTRATLFIVTLTCVFAAFGVNTVVESKTIAKIDGEKFDDKDLLPKGVERNKRKQYAINMFRKVGLPILAEKLIPGCLPAPSKVEVDQYINWWRESAISLRVQALQLSDKPGKLDRQFAVLNVAEKITIENEDAVDYATKEILLWKAYQCIQNKYNGQSFFLPRSFESILAAELPDDDPIKKLMQNSLMNEQPTQRFSLSKKKGFPFPSNSDLPEPTASIGFFLKDVDATGRLSFADEERRDYFFARYETATFLNTQYGEAITKLDTPYWMPSTNP